MTPEVYRLHEELDGSHWWFRARRWLLSRVIGELVPPGKDALIVDVGCAAGGNTAALDEEYRCVGVDSSEEAIEVARSRFPATEFLCGDSPLALGERRREAKLFLLADVLEHVADDRAMLAAWLAAAPAGAWFVVTVPADLRLWSAHDESHGHFRRYDRESLANVWSSLPVSLEMLSYFNSRLYPLVWLSRKLKRHGAAGNDTDLRSHGAFANRLLEAIFAGEAKRLVSLLRGETNRGYRRGVSLIAVLRKSAE